MPFLAIQLAPVELNVRGTKILSRTPSVSRVRGLLPEVRREICDLGGPIERIATERRAVSLGTGTSKGVRRITTGPDPGSHLGVSV